MKRTVVGGNQLMPVNRPGESGDGLRTHRGGSKRKPFGTENLPSLAVIAHVSIVNPDPSAAQFLVAPRGLRSGSVWRRIAPPPL